MFDGLKTGFGVEKCLKSAAAAQAVPYASFFLSVFLVLVALELSLAASENSIGVRWVSFLRP
jgi:hypothetical protein